MFPNADEAVRCETVMALIRERVAAGKPIRLPRPQPGEFDQEGPNFALQRISANDYSGSFGKFRYQLEGEDDLLHLVVTRQDGEPLSVEEARQVAGALFKGVEPGLIWVKPGSRSQHFYLGHDVLLSGNA